jgi:hypothetical protein
MQGYSYPINQPRDRAIVPDAPKTTVFPARRPANWGQPRRRAVAAETGTKS